MTKLLLDGAQLDGGIDLGKGESRSTVHYPTIMNAFHSAIWAILPEKLEEIRAFLHTKAAGGFIADERRTEVLAGRRNDGVQMAGRVAIVPVFGVISQRVSLLEEASGGISTERIGATLESLVADKTVKSIVMAFNTPGGSVYGVPELGEKIRKLRDEKKIVGIADSIAASAGYWLASQTSELYVTPSGQIGSIGVIVSHADLSKMYEQEGVKVTNITSAPYKAEGNENEPLGDEARASLQSKVNAYHEMFVGAIAKGRGISAGTVEKDFGQGRMVLAQEAVSRGMADKVGTMETLLRRLGAVESPSAEASVPGVQAALAAARARVVEIGG